MNSSVGRVDRLFEVIRDENFLDGRISVHPKTLYFFAYSSAEQPELNWMKSYLPIKTTRPHIGWVDMFSCAHELLEREGLGDHIRECVVEKGVAGITRLAHRLDYTPLVDAIIETISAEQHDVTLLWGIGDLSLAFSPSGILSEFHSRMPETTKIVALLPGVVDRDKLLLFGSKERTLLVFRYLNLVQ